MGLKSIEMQVAIPRSQDASKMQDQLSRQGQQFQETLSKQQLRQDIIKRQRTNRQEDVLKRGVEEDGQEEGQKQAKKKKKAVKKAKKDEMKHPYLGRQIDWSG